MLNSGVVIGGCVLRTGQEGGRIRLGLRDRTCPVPLQTTNCPNLQWEELEGK